MKFAATITAIFGAVAISACSVATAPVEATIHWCADANAVCGPETPGAVEMARLAFTRSIAWSQKDREDEFCAVRGQALAGGGQTLELWLNAARTLSGFVAGAALEIDDSGVNAAISCIKGGQTIWGRTCFKRQAAAANSIVTLGCSLVHAIYIPDDSRDSNDTNRRGNIRATATAEPYDAVCAAVSVGGVSLCFDWSSREVFVHNVANVDVYVELEIVAKDFFPADATALPGQTLAHFSMPVVVNGDQVTLRVWQPPNTPYLAPQVRNPADIETVFVLSQADGFVVDSSATWQLAQLTLPVVAGAACQAAVQYRSLAAGGIETREGGSTLSCQNSSNNPIVVDLYALKPGTDTTYGYDFEIGSIYAEPLTQSAAVLTQAMQDEINYALVVKAYDLSDESYLSGAAKGFSVDIEGRNTQTLPEQDLPNVFP